MYRSSSSSHALVLALLLVLGCAGPGIAGGRPDWVSGQSSVYGQELYVAGVGSGSTPEAARDSARAELARVFRSQIDSSILSETTGTIVELEGRSSSKVVEQLEIKTRISTKGDFQDVRIAETWHDRKNSTHFALAVLEKAKMRAKLLAERSAGEGKGNGNGTGK